MDKRFLIDQRSQTQKTYGELLRDLSNPPARVYPTRPFESVYGTVFNLISALLLNKDLTLIDQDFSENELKNVLGDLNRLSQFEIGAMEVSSVEAFQAGIYNSTSILSLFTSGTTGQPKKVNHPVSTFTRSVRCGEVYQNNVWGLAYNATHMAGLQVLLQALCNANTIVNLFDDFPDAILEQLERYRITHLSATPTFFRLISHSRQTFPDVQRITLGGEKCSAELCSTVRKLFPNARLNNIYASTEFGTLLVSNGESFSIPARLATKFKIEDGLLLVHSSLRGQTDLDQPDDWFNTGDVVEVLSHDPLEFRFAARTSDFINVAGYNVNPKEIEDELLKHPDISLALVYGKENRLIGNLLVAEVVPRNRSLTEMEIRHFLADKIQAHKVPRIIKFQETLNVARTGKLKDR